MERYYTEYPTGEFDASSDEEALKLSHAEVIYRQSNTWNGRPFLIIRPENNLEYCPNCKEETQHVLVPDPYFKVGSKCLKCEIVWEIELRIEDQAF